MLVARFPEQVREPVGLDCLCLGCHQDLRVQYLRPRYPEQHRCAWEVFGDVSGDLVRVWAAAGEHLLSP